MEIIRGMGKLIHLLDDAVFPSGLYCICCGSMIDKSRSYSLCDDCIRRFHWITGETCELCGKALPEREFACGGYPRLCYDCMSRRPLFTKGYSCLTYGLHEREIMMDLKYAGKGYIARICGDIMFDRMEEEICHGRFSPEHDPIDFIVPVPISRERVGERGYNQSAFMARQLARRWRNEFKASRPVPILHEELLYRSRKTRKLRGLNPAERALELEGAFRVRHRYLEKIRSAGTDPQGEGEPGRRGARILLIDDIHTTGATANACTKALMDAGASEVFFLSLASGGNRRPAEL